MTEAESVEWTAVGAAAQLVRNAAAGLHLSEHPHGDGTEIFEHACKPWHLRVLIVLLGLAVGILLAFAWEYL